MPERLITPPQVHVAETEFRRLLGYPRGHEPSPRAQELAEGARRWFAEHGRPWMYHREATLDVRGDTLRFDGIEFRSPELRAYLRQAGAQRAVFIVVSAGRACEEHARRLWEESKPDEYFFLETFGSAVVESLVAAINGQVCADVERAGFSALPHYSPGYGTWDVSEQNALHELIMRGRRVELPEPLEVLSSGMLRPKKSLLGIIGLTTQTTGHHVPIARVPCINCSFTPCQFRRAPYRHAAATACRAEAPASATIDPARRGADNAPEPRSVLTRNAPYSINPRALAKWARERVRLEPVPDGSLVARFRYDGTTCSNMGRPLAFEYRVILGPADAGFPIRAAACRPCEDDEGYRFMCEYLRDPEGLMAAIATERPLVGEPLDAVLDWERRSAPSGCYCDPDSRRHKWGLALEAIHYALAQNANTAAPASTTS